MFHQKHYEIKNKQNAKKISIDLKFNEFQCKTSDCRELNQFCWNRNKTNSKVFALRLH